MTKWTRGRLRRPIASLISGFLLLSLLLPLAPHQAQAQMPDIAKLFGETITSTTPIVVLDFNNRSTYLTGMPGRTFADAISMELMRTRTFEVVKRQLVEQVLDENNLSTPLSPQAQSMVAERLKCAYTLAGDIQNIQIHRSKNGTSAEVEVNVVVISRVTQLPINGAHIVQTSSPKIGYSGNTDVLVQEALATAAYQATQRLLDNRLPIGTVLSSPRNGEVIVKGGSTVGFRAGMECTTIRRETVTGRVRLMDVTPNEGTGAILEESKGIAPGDKVLPIYETKVTSPRATKAARERTAIQIASFAGAALLATLIGTENGNKDMKEFAAPTVTSLADAAALNHLNGANLLRWTRPSSRVIAYVLYRDTNPFSPIAVVDGNTTFYVDSTDKLPQTTNLMESTQVEIELDETSGDITTFNYTTTYEDTLDDLNNPDMTSDLTSFSVTTHRVPLSPGETCGYSIRVLYVDYDHGTLDKTDLGHPEQYRLYLGNKSGVSARVTVTAAPKLDKPGNEQPLDGIFQCTRVPSALTYTLQVSSDPNFPNDPTKTVTKPAYVQGDVYANTTYPYLDLWSKFHNSNNLDIPIYWRMGAKVDGQLPPVALSDAGQNGYVYSAPSIFMLSAAPPDSLSRRFNHLIGVPGKTGNSGRGDRDNRRILRR